MTVYRCQKGCTRRTRGGETRPLWHKSKRECPYETDYTGPPVASPAGIVAETKTPDTVVSSEPSPVVPKAEVKKGPGILSFGSRPATTTTRTGPATTPVQPEWEVDSDHSLSFFELIDNILIRVIHFIDHALDVKEFQGHVLLNSSADEELVKKKMGRRIVSNIAKGLGATTQEEAHGIIDSGGVLVIIGGGIMAVGSHMLVEWRKSPKLKEWNEKRKKKKEPVLPEGLPLNRTEGT